MKKKEYSIEFGGRTLTAEFNDLAENANGSVLVKYADTVILATAVMSKYAKEGASFFPLTVDYEERFYAAGAILGSQFIRREGRPSDEAVLAGRITDRTIRPLFDQHIRHDIQVVLTILSLGEADPDVLGVIAASLAIATSDIPWNGPVSAVRLGKHSGTDTFEVNPSYTSRQKDDTFELDLVACGKDGNINMIEVGGKEVPEATIMFGLELASREIEKMQDFQKKIVAEIGKTKRIIPKQETPEELKKLFAEKIEPRLYECVFTGEPGKEKMEALKDEWLTLLEASHPEANGSLGEEYFEEKVNDIIHKEAIENERRPDGRGIDDLRPLYAQAGGMSKILHGCGIFYRGGTHIFSALTLGGPQDAQMVDNMESQEFKKRFMHHYNFPPFSTGETGRIGSTNRRMIGHGALAEKAIQSVLPPKTVFPYTIRIVSEAFSSNGSTSMGSVCGSILALMDGGVPIKAPVAGIASGLMMESSTRYKVLTDIQGPEDHHGDMDFKVAGTREGVTAIQMDVKVGGIPLPILSEALEKAKSARLRILDVMKTAIAEARPDISPNAPKIKVIMIKPDQIGLVIGTGGKTIKEIKESTGADIDIEDDGTVYITGKNGTADAAASIIEEMTRQYKAGDKLTGEVVKIMEFGAFVKIGRSEGLVHISEIAPFRVNKVTDVLREGEIVPVVVKGVDERDRIKLSIKDVDPEFAKRKIKK